MFRSGSGEGPGTARPGHQVPLAVGHAERVGGRALRLGLDALGDDLAARLCCEVHQADHHRLAYHVGVDITDETSVHLDQMRSEFDEVAEVRDSGAGVVDRDPDVCAEPFDGGATAA